MIRISKRQIRIIEILLQDNEFVTIDSIAEKLSVSNRTVRNDLGQISAFLNENGLSLEKKSHNGIRLDLTDNEQIKLEELIKKEATNEITSNQRVNYIILRLLICQYSTYEQIAIELDISKQTVINTFDLAEDMMSQFDISIVKQKGVGLYVSANERKLRDCFEKVLFANTTDQSIINRLADLENIKTNLVKAEKLINILNDEKEIDFSKDDKIKVLFAYVFTRYELGKQLNDITHFEKYRKSIIYQCLNGNVENLLEDSDLLYLTAIATTYGSFNMNESLLVSEKDKSDAKEITSFLLDKLRNLQNVNLIQQEAFVEGLSIHMASAIYRLRNNIAVKNNILEQIKYRIALMYEFTKQQLLLCEKDYDLEFTENEIAYIAMYLTSAYEDSLRDDFSCRVLLVCSFGLTTSAILKSRIAQNIPESTMIGPYNVKEAKQYLKSNPVDLIISTIEFENEYAKTIVVNPLLSIEDITSIKENLVQISFDIMCGKFLSAYRKTEEVKEVAIKDTISRDRVNIVESVKDWQQAIRLAAKPLVEDSSLDKRYVDRMIEAVNEYGTYMVLVPLVAFVHAGVDDGINKECSSILVMKNPLMFGDKNPKQVRAIIVMGVKDKNNNSLLNNVYIMENDENQKKLTSKDLTIDDVLNMKIEKE